MFDRHLRSLVSNWLLVRPTMWNTTDERCRQKTRCNYHKMLRVLAQLSTEVCHASALSSEDIFGNVSVWAKCYEFTWHFVLSYWTSFSSNYFWGRPLYTFKTNQHCLLKKSGEQKGLSDTGCNFSWHCPFRQDYSIIKQIIVTSQFFTFHGFYERPDLKWSSYVRGTYVVAALENTIQITLTFTYSSMEVWSLSSAILQFY